MFRRGIPCAGWFINPTFSSRVKRPTKSFARSAKVNDVSRYKSFSDVLVTLMQCSFEISSFSRRRAWFIDLEVPADLQQPQHHQQAIVIAILTCGYIQIP